MHCFRQTRVVLLLAAMLLAAVPAAAVTVKIDYSLDTGNFFAGGNPQGATGGTQARAALEAVATFYSNILNDTLAAIIPPTYTSPRTTVTWTWTMKFTHPSANFQTTLTDKTIAADEYRIYVGAQAHAGTTLALSGPGGVDTWGRTTQGNPNSTDLNQIHAIDAAFEDAFTTRGETSGFAAWGGSMSFDNDTNWHFNHTTTPTAGKTDFFTVATHEMAHVLGFGASTTWNSLVSGSSFNGTAAMANYGGPVPLGAGNGHWLDNGNASIVFGGSTSQTPIMVPALTPATRRQLTALDAAALTDLGWSVIPLPGIFGDYNNNGVVDAADYVVWRSKLNQSVTIPNDSTPGTVTAADYTVWRTNFGKMPAASGSIFGESAVPEPAGSLLAAVGCIVVLCWHRKRRG